MQSCALFQATQPVFSASHRQILVDEQQKLIRKEIRTRLDEWLKPPVHVANNQCNAANAHHPKTGMWLLERPEFREWIYAPGSFLWLHGISGSGKTVLSSTIIDTIHDRAEHYVFFYFDTNNSEQQTVTQLLCSLVTQLSIRSHPPDRRLDALWTSHNSGQKLLTDTELISDALLPLLEEYDQKPIFIVLDALDECSERPGLLRLIGRMLDAKLPNVHILVTSRPEVQSGCPELAALAVSVSLEGCVDGDIELYLTELLSNEPKIGWMYKKRDEIKRRLLERSKGMFRLVSLQLDELRNCDGRRSQVEKALNNMPTSLNTIYDRILQNIKNPGMLSSVCRAMNWLIFSKRPLTLNEIIDALAFDFEREPLLFDTEERMDPDVLLPACAGFVAVSGGAKRRVRLAHSSVKEYFLGATRLQLSGDCEISEQAAHHLLARTCIAYLCSCSHVLNSDADLERYPLTLYAAENWVFHLKLCDGMDKCGSPEKCQNEHIKSTQYTTLLILYDVEHLYLRPWLEWTKRAAPHPPLYVAACLGIGQIVWELLESGADMNADGGEYGNALQAASCLGHIEVVRLLLESGADVNAEVEEYDSALEIALARGQMDIVNQLLESGAHMNVQGGQYGNALQAASLWGHIEVARLLFESGAHVNARSGRHGTALYAACYGGPIEIVCLLLESGADINAQSGTYGNALQVALARGEIGIVRLLFEGGAHVDVQGGRYDKMLRYASRRGDTECADLLREMGATDKDDENSGGSVADGVL
ncbi:ankyrin repeat-containing domain protein [Mycena rebaudengoi]|nr:ankyrin repeat-containing domain protein [Mycena rebaudengoi]